MHQINEDVEVQVLSCPGAAGDVRVVLWIRREPKDVQRYDRKAALAEAARLLALARLAAITGADEMRTKLAGEVLSLAPSLLITLANEIEQLARIGVAHLDAA